MTITREDIVAKYDIKEYTEERITLPDLSGVKGITLVVGSSGSGKSTILRSISDTGILFDENTPIIDLFYSIERAEKYLLATGLRSIPTWFRPLSQVSNGERHRAECALYLDLGTNCIDEFTSVVDRNTAKSLSASMRKHYTSDEPLFIATCHHDVEEWLCPDYVYDTDLKVLRAGRYLRRPDIGIRIQASTVEDWVYFRRHHYLDTSMSKAVHCYTAYVNGAAVGFLAVIHGTSGQIRSYWRECRLVILPEFQGLGIGTMLSHTIAQEYINRSKRYFSKTAHPAMGKMRDASSLWRGTSTNHKDRASYIRRDGSLRKTDKYGGSKNGRAYRDALRVCYSHEYMGDVK